MQCIALLKSGKQCSRIVTAKTISKRFNYQHQTYFDESTVNRCLCGTHFRLIPEFRGFSELQTKKMVDYVTQISAQKPVEWKKVEKTPDMLEQTCVITMEIIEKQKVCKCSTCNKVMKYKSLLIWFETHRVCPFTNRIRPDSCPHCRSVWTNYVKYVNASV